MIVAKFKENYKIGNSISFNGALVKKYAKALCENIKDDVNVRYIPSENCYVVEIIDKETKKVYEEILEELSERHQWFKKECKYIKVEPKCYTLEERISRIEKQLGL